MVQNCYACPVSVGRDKEGGLMTKRTWEEIENQTDKEKVWDSLTKVRMTKKQKEEFIREFHEQKFKERMRIVQEELAKRAK